MKKILLSFALIASFIFYSLVRQSNKSNNPDIVSQTVNPTNPQSDPAAPIQNIQGSAKYKNGEYTGDSVDAYYGNVQVKITVQNNKISKVQFLDYPQDRNRSKQINSYAMPILQSETIQAQSAQVDAVSGATQTSLGYIQSLQTALIKATQP